MDLYNVVRLVCTVGENCTIDEMLDGFNGGRCSFRQYIIPYKPNKYGIEIQALVDSLTSNTEVRGVTHSSVLRNDRGPIAFGTITVLYLPRFNT